jgi:hypothetical protein
MQRVRQGLLYQKNKERIAMKRTENSTEYNECLAWKIKCKSQKMTEKCLTLLCQSSSRKKDGSYTKPVNINVIVLADKCRSGECKCEQDDYADCFIEVDGHYQPDEYKDIRTGQLIPIIKIWATRVEKVDFNSNKE